jgi:LysR family transcriptional regulator (chromosome initiation inhibitor)
MLDYKLLEAFALTILEGGFEKASRKLHLTQSAVSQRVKLLEDQYGQILLKRTSPPEPTESGLPLLVHYRQVSQLETDLRFDLKNKAAPEFASLAIAVNADSLATWFFAAVKEVLEEERLVLELHVDDQERTHELMQDGKVWGCISTRSQPLQGCRATRLGRVRYGIFASGDFAEKWFPGGLTRDALERAPMARFNRKDDLNSRMFALLLPRPPDNPPTFFLPSTEIYCLFIVEGKCYGILPEQQSNVLEAAGRIINLSPGHWLNVDLYWHSWNLKSTLMERFSRHFIAGSRKILGQEA